ncbi:hypothetical protein GLOTRDRAFT_76253 [Gloeophyllum trabeum ATCC 11539]|uniref:MFS general substrate transporter n=1 Tax=Gloeophyllum trabeum (strain ATCC 11539 / FP-39264 / Madison 617) TaxID=670483 RepID=S7RSM7_GLOTA|nr:uncharacterized protein GLOTRDRAFT_76253 [Gloeophyllum trabeum ATCC 11539]EPQ56029.1 hypothetical protein GLOTRDRAFT_76253 [Gloeophyllum trabeum ATCC 11539]
MEVLWSVLTMILATSKSFESLVVIRFFVGLAESTFYPAIQYVIGSWYKGDELGKRACLFHVRPAPRLKSFNSPGHTVYSIAQINLYPLGINAVQVVTTLTWAWWSDAVRARWPPMIVAGTWQMVNCIVLASSPLYTHITRRWVFYYFTLCQGGLSGLILAWANELTGYDNEKRSFVVACCNTFAYVFQAWLPIVLFPQVEQPRVQKGTIATIFINFGMVCFALLTMALQKRDERRKKLQEVQDAVANDPDGLVILETYDPLSRKVSKDSKD